MLIGLRPCFACAIAATVIFLSLSVQAESPKSADTPELKLGDRWKKETRDLRTGIALRSTETVVASVSSSKIELTINGGPGVMTSELAMIDSPRIAFNPGYQDLKFPLEVGKKWTFTTRWHNKESGNKGQTQLDVEIKGQERIKVTAGEFEAFKIEAVGYINFDGGGSRRVTSTYWYAPHAKTVVRFEWIDRRDDYVTELIELSLAP